MTERANSPGRFCIDVIGNPEFKNMVPYPGWRFRFEKGFIIHEPLPPALLDRILGWLILKLQMMQNQ